MKEIATPNQSKTVVTRERRFQLDRGDIVRYFKMTGIKIPPEAKITITMPSGGDYSGEILDIGQVNYDTMNDDIVIDIKWTETKEIDQ